MNRLDEPLPVTVDNHHAELVAWVYLRMEQERRELHAVVRMVNGDGPHEERAVPIWRFRMRREEAK